MKKILLGVALSVAVLQGCKKDNTDDEEVVQLTVDEQKEYDDAAALDFLNKHYLDSKGVITTFDDTTDTDNNEKKLADYNYVKLPSGVIYIVRPGAQPNPGKDVMSNDVISFFNITKTYSATKTNDKTSEPREIRRKLGLNQQQFWSALGVTQSGGSRYESGRNMPKPVRELLRLVHVEQIDVKNIKQEDWEVAEYLRSQEPELFKTLKKAARNRTKKAA